MKLPIIKENSVENVMFESFHDMIMPIYFDNNATTRVDEDAVIAMMDVMENYYGNPSALHKSGQRMADLINDARNNIASFIGCAINQFIFVSSGTEAINSVIDSVVKLFPRKNRIITCVTEHNATLNKLKFDTKHDICYLSVDHHGRVSLDELEGYLKNDINNNALFTIMACNNETGTIHKNIFDAITLAHKYNCLVHIDAVQIAGKLPIKPYIDAGVDYLTISGHKFHCPKGIGVLYFKDNTTLYPIFFGGNQEYGLRAGTENAPAIIAMGTVARKNPLFTDNMKNMHDLFISLLTNRIPSCIINGGDLPGTINVGFKYIHRDAMVVKLSENMLYSSIGSACSTGLQPSHVLKAMNVPNEYINGSLRFSFSKYTTEYEVRKSIDIIEKAYNELRNISIGIIA